MPNNVSLVPSDIAKSPYLFYTLRYIALINVQQNGSVRTTASFKAANEQGLSPLQVMTEHSLLNLYLLMKYDEIFPATECANLI